MRGAQLVVRLTEEPHICLLQPPTPAARLCEQRLIQDHSSTTIKTHANARMVTFMLVFQTVYNKSPSTTTEIHEM